MTMIEKHDPIEQLREAFDAIEPSASQKTRWRERMQRASSARGAVLRSGREAPAHEPLPWRMLIGSAVAAVIAVVVTVAGLPPAPHGESSEVFAADIGRVTDDASTMAGPVLTLAAPDGTRLYVHLPSTGIDWSAQWDLLRAAIALPFEPLRQATGA